MTEPLPSMKKRYLFLLVVFSLQWTPRKEIADPSSYMSDLKTELTKEWPKNRAINLVFHGHSVPAGYFKTPVVNTLEAYPYQVLKQLKALYPYAVINVINTSIGGESSKGGADRFETEVLVHRPDVIFIDYALNDRGMGLEEARKAWVSMIQKAAQKKIKVILLTPSPDQRTALLDPESALEKHRKQIIEMAKEHNLGLVDSYAFFQKKIQSGEIISSYMSQVNHPNEKGHQLIADGIMTYFR